MKQSGILVRQKLAKGFLGGPLNANFTVKENNIIYEISIEQCGIRKTSIKAKSSVDIESLVNIFNKLDMLIMLGEGEFIPVSEAKTIENNIEFDSEELKSLFTNRVKMFSSADFTKGSVNSFLSFDKYVNTKTFTDWSNLLSELDIAHNIVLYSLADTGMTIDCKCVFLIEAFEALSELIKKNKVQNFTYRKAKTGESQLQLMLIAVLEKYGNDIFKEEMCLSTKKFTHLFRFFTKQTVSIAYFCCPFFKFV